MACCTDIQLPNDDDYSVAESEDNKASRSKKKESDKKAKRLNVSYTKATPLFKAIEKQQWESVLMFLNTSKWSNSFFVSSTDHLKSPTPSLQCQTWVTYYNPVDRQVEWSQLPIHAAISYAAPAVVIQKIVDIFPDCLKERDNEGMLPVHLAFGFALPDPVLSLLLRTYPESAQERGPGGRLPHQCCELGPNKIRGEVFGLVAEQTSDMARNDQQEYFKGFIVETHKKLSIDEALIFDGKELKDLIRELVEDRKQLLDLKKKIKKVTVEAQAKSSEEYQKSKKSSKSPKGEKKVKSTKDSSKLTIDTDSKTEDLQNMSISENSPVPLKHTSSKHTKTPGSTENKTSSSHPTTTPKSTKYSSKLSKARDSQ